MQAQCSVFSNGFHSFLLVCKYTIYISSSLKYLIKLLKQTVPGPFRIKVSRSMNQGKKKQGISAFSNDFQSFLFVCKYSLPL